jgi:hypothetical protein
MRDDQVVEVMGQGNYTGEFLLSPTFSFGNFRRRKLGFGKRENEGRRSKEWIGEAKSFFIAQGK